MKRNFIQMVAFTTVLLGLVAIASAREHDACSVARVAGDWSYVFTGTFILPTGAAVPAAVVGKATFDAAGNFSGTQTSSVGGTVSAEASKGTFTSNADCTGTFTVGIYDQAGNLLRKATFATVDNGTEGDAIMTSLMIGNTPVASVVTMHMKKLLPDHGNQK